MAQVLGLSSFHLHRGPPGFWQGCECETVPFSCHILDRLMEEPGLGPKFVLGSPGRNKNNPHLCKRVLLKSLDTDEFETNI